MASTKRPGRGQDTEREPEPIRTGAAEGGDWRDAMLARVRALITAADPAIVEERKWNKPSNGMTGVPVWPRDGIVCTGETYRDKVKLTFARGAALDETAFAALVGAAVALNGSGRKAGAPRRAGA